MKDIEVFEIYLWPFIIIVEFGSDTRFNLYRFDVDEERGWKEVPVEEYCEDSHVDIAEEEQIWYLRENCMLTEEPTGGAFVLGR
jgi:hypothetical protein